MILLDSNIFIYLANGTLSSNIISNTDISHASITKIECLGYSRITANELLLLEDLFNESYCLSLTSSITDRAIRLRQARSMTLADSIIAATALENNLALWTANVQDFSHIHDLTIFNPLKS